MTKLKILQVLTYSSNSKRLRSKQAGAITAFYSAAVLPVIAITLFFVFNTAQVLRNKMSLQNTADASTYSAALVYARALNFTAYTNRAMAANEAGIASLAAMHTSSGMIINALANVSNMASYSHYIGYGAHVAASIACYAKADVICGDRNRDQALSRWKSTKYHAGIASSHDGFQTANGILFNVGEDMLRVLNYAIATSQQVSYYASLVEIPIVAKDIIIKNDPSAYPSKGSDNEVAFGVQMAAFLAQCSLFTDVYWDYEGLKGLDLSATNSFKQITSGFKDGFKAFTLDQSPERVNEIMRFGHVAKGARDMFTKQRQILPEALTRSTTIWMPDKARALVPYDWAGATELVSEDENGKAGEGRIRWQSADRVNAKTAINVALGDTKAGLGTEVGYSQLTFADGDGVDEKRKALNLDMANLADQVFTVGVSTAAQGGPFSEGSWKGDLLQLSSALSMSRTYGGINVGNGTVLDATKKYAKDGDGLFGIRGGIAMSDADAAKVAISDALYSDEKTNGFRNAAFYRSIHGLNYEQGGILNLYDLNNTHAVGIYGKSWIENGFKDPITSSWNHGQNQKIGRFTSETPMPFFRDVAHHPQEIAYEFDEALGDAINNFDKNDVVGSFKKMFNLTDRGPSFAMTLTKDIKHLNLREQPVKNDANSKVNSKFKNNQLVVLSSAGVYFRRPQDHWTRSDAPKDGKGAFLFGFTGGYIEHKNLFSPYWHVRNQQPLAATRLATLLAYFI